MGLNPTIRRMQQMGIAVPMPIQPVGHVQVQAGQPGAPRMLAQRRFVPLQRNSSVQVALRQAPGNAVPTSSTSRVESYPSKTLQQPGKMCKAVIVQECFFGNNRRSTTGCTATWWAISRIQ
ncbi:hypothetical protein ANCCAN_28520 [Ancylostoma caninum]|uniref:Uncharacterized protein n=1 Tax=Ancylostoma caninum TaxID=29170 RepID=A0A368F4B4_ANCCA|nr:hypothetical protein ANCCAN_28520 [Ancylostoma caninum]